MADHPIIFSSPMVAALLDGRKTMTRRLAWRSDCGKQPTDGGDIRFVPSSWQAVAPGARLWVREKYHLRPIASAAHAYSYADEQDETMLGGWKKVRLLPADHPVKRPDRPKWVASMFMPREFSRLTLIVESAKVEPVQSISPDDAHAEGWPGPPAGYENLPAEVHRDAARNWFIDAWESLHGPASWCANPEVVAISFRVIKANIDAQEAH